MSHTIGKLFLCFFLFLHFHFQDASGTVCRHILNWHTWNIYCVNSFSVFLCKILNFGPIFVVFTSFKSAFQTRFSHRIRFLVKRKQLRFTAWIKESSTVRSRGSDNSSLSQLAIWFPKTLIEHQGNKLCYASF